jgi:uncharacterized membrane protein
MADNKNEHLVVAYFDSKEQAEQAADSLKGWDKANDDIKMGAIAVLSKNDKGKIETTKMGPRNTGKGAKIGVIVGVIAGILTGGLSLVGGAIWGAVLGSAAGTLSKKGIGLSKEEVERMGGELDNGHAALLAMVDENEVTDTTAELTRLGGKAQASEVAPEAVAQAEQALSSTPAAAETTTSDASAKAQPTDTSPASSSTDTPPKTPEANG